MSPSEFRALLAQATARPWAMDFTPTGPCGQRVHSEMIYAADGSYRNVVQRVTYDTGGPRQECNNAGAIVTTMNRAELFAELWDVAKDIQEEEWLAGTNIGDVLDRVLAKLEAAE